MKYDHNAIEKKWQKYWKESGTFQAENSSKKPKYYVLDMFPYPSGAGLHVGHPLGYIASDIYARYKRHKGFNVLHPQGYDSFGLPAEQYAIQTGQHPKDTTEINIDGVLDTDGIIKAQFVNDDNTVKESALLSEFKSGLPPFSTPPEEYNKKVIKGYRRQLDKIGFSFDWSREVRTSDPDYYKWTQWIFIQLFESWYNKETDKAEAIDTLIAKFVSEGNTNVSAACDDDTELFSAEAWSGFSTKKKQEILLKYRLTYLAETEVNWCAALGTVLANDEIVNGVSERGGHPVVRKKMTQWSMRISAYAQRLLDGLQNIDWPQPLKDSQKNWIGRSQGAMVNFPLEIPPTPKGGATQPGYMTGGNNSHLLIERAKEMRDNPTQAESVLWEQLVSKKLSYKFRRQHLIDDLIADFVCLSKKLIVEVDGDIHDTQVEKDEARTVIFEDLGYKVIRFKNEEVTDNLEGVLAEIKSQLEARTVPPSGVRGISVFTTRPDTIFGVTFMTLAPEHELVQEITTPAQKVAVETYISETAKRSERERMADVNNITGVFTGAYAEHPFTKEPVPIWIGDYVLAGYGTGAVMAVPCGDQRDHDFAMHFAGAEGMPPIKNIFKHEDITEAAHIGKDGTVITNSDFLNDLPYKKALKSAIYELDKIDQGSGKINYRLRDAVFSRQRYWGEPFPVYYVDGMPQMIDKKYLPLRLPEVEKYLPTEEGEPPLGRAEKWHWNTNTNTISPPAPEGGANGADDERHSELDSESHSGIYPLELNTMPGWAGSSWYFFRYMEKALRDEVFASKEAMDYWKNVDLYIGGSEHATGHLLYSRFWVKFLHDRGFVPVEEPFKKLINQGMILGEGAFLYFIEPIIMYQNEEMTMSKDCPLFLDRKFLISYSKLQDENTWVLDGELAFNNKKLQSYFYEKLLEKYQNFESDDEEILEYVNNIDKVKVVSIFAYARRVNIDLLKGTSDSLNTTKLKLELHKNNLNDFEFFLDNGELTVGREVEKMSKSKYNVVNPDDICEDYGADTLRMYEMFLGPLEQAKPWNTAGISGVYNFLKKFWKLFHEVDKEGNIGEFKSPQPLPHGQAGPKGEQKGDAEGLKILHRTIKKVEDDIENFSFNTSVSTFMIAVNELTAINCNAREVLEPLTVLLSPYAPHIAEELWEKLGHSGSISAVPFPIYEEKYTKETNKEYPISFNGKMRFTMTLPLDLSKDKIEKAVMENEKTQEYLEGRTPKKVIIVPGKIVNLVG